jgi:hypothetical protein
VYFTGTLLDGQNFSNECGNVNIYGCILWCTLLDGQRILAMNVEYVVCYGCIMQTILDVVDLGRGRLVWMDVLLMCIKCIE